jgi:hypothetical protein
MAEKEVIFRYLICQKGIDTQLFSLKTLILLALSAINEKKHAKVKSIEV